MAWLENGELISDVKSRELCAKGWQFVEGVLLPPDKVNALIRSGYTTPHLANGLRYTFTHKEGKRLGLFLGVGLVSIGTLSISQYAKSKYNNRKKK